MESLKTPMLHEVDVIHLQNIDLHAEFDPFGFFAPDNGPHIGFGQRNDTLGDAFLRTVIVELLLGEDFLDGPQPLKETGPKPILSHLSEAVHAPSTFAICPRNFLSNPSSDLRRLLPSL
jgi:hypothetical protein